MSLISFWVTIFTEEEKTLTLRSVYACLLWATVSWKIISFNEFYFFIGQFSIKKFFLKSLMESPAIKMDPKSGKATLMVKSRTLINAAFPDWRSILTTGLFGNKVFWMKSGICYCKKGHEIWMKYFLRRALPYVSPGISGSKNSGINRVNFNY